MTALLRRGVVRCWSWLDRQLLALPTRTLRRSIFFGSAALLFLVPFPSFLALWACVVWLAPRAYRDRADLLRLEELLRKLIWRVERALEQAETMVAAETSSAVFRRVGLADNVPLHVAEAARRSYRSKLHPDGHPEHRKAEASRRFRNARQSSLRFGL